MAFSRRLEKDTFRKITMMYCNAKHNTKNNGRCSDCLSLLDYAEQRIDKCVYGDNKPVCSKCQVHCYRPTMREKIKEIMQYSGPRMLFKSPILSIRYMYRKIFKSNIQ